MVRADMSEITKPQGFSLSSSVISEHAQKHSRVFDKMRYLQQEFVEQCAAIHKQWQEDRVKLTRAEKRIIAV